MAEPKVAVPQNPMDAMLANFLGGVTGGNVRTTSPGNTAPLEETLASLRGQDPSALLQSIFQQAGGQIPGLQVALSNAIGARSGGNSAVSQALQKLLQQTTLAGQDQLAKQQAQNLATQVQAGTGIAQATRGTAERTGASSGESLRNLAILQALSKTGVLEKLGLGSKAVKEGGKAPGGQAPVSTAIPTELPGMQSSGAITSAVSPQGAFNAQPLESAAPMDFSQYLQQAAPGTGSDFSTTGDYGFTYNAPQDVGPSPIYAEAPQDQFEMDWQDAWNDYSMPEYADGGLVRGAKTEEEAEVNATTAFDAGNLRNKLAETLVALISSELGGGAKKPEHGYADGGVVRAGGSRRGLNPSVDLYKPQGMQALNGGSMSGTQGIAPLLGGGGAQQVPWQVNSALSKSPSTLAAAAGLARLGSLGVKELGGDAGTASDLGTAATALNFVNNPEAAAKQLALRKGTEAVLAETIGKKAVPYAGAVIGGINALTAEDEKDKFAGAARVGMNFIPVVGPMLGALDDLSGGNMARSGGGRLSNDFYALRDSATNPIEATGNYIENTLESTAEDARFVGDTLSHWGDVAGDVISNPIGAVSDTVSHWGNVISSFFGGWKEGGHIQGPGTGTSDSIPAKLSDGEYVIPADVVDKLGVEFFEKLRNQFHTPAAQQT